MSKITHTDIHALKKSHEALLEHIILGMQVVLLEDHIEWCNQAKSIIETAEKIYKK